MFASSSPPLEEHLGVSKNRCTQNGWFIMVPNPIKMDDLVGPPLFLETSIWI